MISALNGLALTKIRSNDYLSALDLIKKSLEIADVKVGGLYPSLLPIIHNLSYALEKTGNHAFSNKAAGESLEINSQGLAHDNVVSLMVIKRAIELPAERQDYVRATDLYKRVLEQEFAERNPLILYHLACTALKQQDWANWMYYSAEYYDRASFQVDEAERLLRARSAISKFKDHSPRAQALKLDCKEEDKN